MKEVRLRRSFQGLPRLGDRRQRRRLHGELLVVPCVKRFEPIVCSTLCMSHVNDLPFWRDGWHSQLCGCRLDAEHVTHACFIMRVCVLVADLLIGYSSRQQNIFWTFVLPFVRVVVGKRADEPSPLDLPRPALAFVNLGISSWTRVVPFAMVLDKTIVNDASK